MVDVGVAGEGLGDEVEEPEVDAVVNPAAGPETWALHELSRKTVAAPAAAIRRGGQADAGGMRDQPVRGTFRLLPILADLTQSRSSIDNVTGRSPLAAKPARICGSARTVPE